MFLARKITQAKWRPKAGFAEGEIAADAVTVDLKTQDNSLSFWRCPTETTQDLEKAVLAIAATRNTVLLIVCPNVGGGFSPPSESGELYQSLGVFPVGLQCLGQGLVQRVDGGKELIG